MTLLEEIEQQLSALPPEKQGEVLDFVTFLQQKASTPVRPGRQHSLRKHAAFGSWRERKIDSLIYQQTLRSEWDEQK